MSDAVVTGQSGFVTERRIAYTAREQLVARVLRLRMFLQVARIAEALVANLAYMLHLLVRQSVRFEAGAGPEALVADITDELRWTLDDLVCRGIRRALIIIIISRWWHLVLGIRRVGPGELVFQLVESHVGRELGGGREASLTHVTDVVPRFPVDLEAVADEGRVLREAGVALVAGVELVGRHEDTVVRVQQFLGLEGELAGGADFSLRFRNDFVLDKIGEFELGMDAVEVALHVPDVDESSTALGALVEVCDDRNRPTVIDVF